MSGDGDNLIKLRDVEIIHNSIRSILDDNDMDCVLITSPLELTAITGDQKIITIDCKEYSYNELQDVLEKAWMYDDLNK